LTATALQLVALYDATENTYLISAHNKTPEETQKLIQEYNQHLKPGFSLIAIDQQKPHKTADAQKCRACRDTVARSSGLTPTPQFKRRKQ